jgi:hypothetical protein
VKVARGPSTKRTLEIVVPPGQLSSPEVIEAKRLLEQRVTDGFSPKGIEVVLREGDVG